MNDHIENKPKTHEPKTYTVADIASMLNIGKTTAYLLVQRGYFKTIRIGASIRISKKSFDEWLDGAEIE